MLKNGVRLNATPIYGWGWRCGNKAVEIPTSFDIETEYTEFEGRILKRADGRIVQPSHPLNGFWISVTKRTVMEGDLHCDLVIKESEPPWDSDRRLKADQETLTGYAVIREMGPE